MHKKIIFTVTNELSYDQRMLRICRSLAAAGYSVLLVGRKRKGALPLDNEPFDQKRLPVIFSRGKLFYAEFNIRLFFYLLFRRADAISAIDLDTILPCYFVSKLKRIPRVYDAHELFCEMKEVVTRPRIYKIWKRVERFAVPRFKHGYTVNALIAAAFREMYGMDYKVIRNISKLEHFDPPVAAEKFILYQGAVNEGRSFETLIPAMEQVHARLVVCGDGNFMTQAQALTDRYKLHHKIIFKGKLLPEELKPITRSAYLGLNLVENKGANSYASLANRFFDYMHAELPQLCVDYPAYREINNLYEVAVLIQDLSAESIAASINSLLADETTHRRLRVNCLAARQLFNWQEEEKKLIAFYNRLLQST